MKFVIAFLIFCSMQNQLVQSDTLDDVLENFRQEFDEMHGVLDTLFRTLIRYSQEEVLAFKYDVDDQLDLNVQTVSAAQEVIHNSEATMLEELGLVGQAHVIGDCIKERDNSFKTVEENAIVTNYASSVMKNSVFQLVKSTIESFNHTQHVRHLLIEETKYKCKDASSNPQEMHTCLYNEIHYQHKPALVELEKDKSATQREVDSVLLDERIIIQIGSSFIKTAIFDYKRFVLNEFRSCCYKVVGKN